MKTIEPFNGIVKWKQTKTKQQQGKMKKNRNTMTHWIGGSS